MFKKIKKEIPGHFLGFTWVLALVAGVATFYFSHNRSNAIIGILIILLGAFVGDQATTKKTPSDISIPWALLSSLRNLDYLLVI